MPVSLSTFDTLLLDAIRALPNVEAICAGKKIYHFEVIQSQGFSNYPCIAYNLTSDTPYRELDGVSGLRIATFTFQSLSKSTADIRTLSADLQSLGNDPVTTIAGVSGQNILDWIYVDDTTDTFEPCVDLDEKGMKASEQTVTLIYRG